MLNTFDDRMPGLAVEIYSGAVPLQKDAKQERWNQAARGRAR